MKTFRYYDLLMAAFVTVLLCSNLIGAGKPVTWAGFTFGAGIFFFPLSYIFGDILTEVYGYARSRKVVWAGFAAMGFASLMAWVVIQMPAAEGWEEGQRALETALGNTPRIAAASMLAFFCGEFTNSYVLAKMKIWTGGRWVWSRTIGSTVFGEAVDSTIFYPLAFLGVWPTEIVIKVMISNYFLKVGWEVVMTPVTLPFITWLKKKENEDYFDYKTNFTPFSLKTEESKT